MSSIISCFDFYILNIASSPSSSTASAAAFRELGGFNGLEGVACFRVGLTFAAASETGIEPRSAHVAAVISGLDFGGCEGGEKCS